MSSSFLDLPLVQRFTPLLRWRYAVLVVLAVGWALRGYLPAEDTDWHFFVWGSELLFGRHPSWAHEPGGLHIFANYSSVQIGPLTLAVVAVFRLFLSDEGSRIAAIVLMTAVGPLLVYVLERASVALGPSGEDEERLRRWMVLLGGAVVIVAWEDLAAYFVHLDDALTLLFSCLAIWAVARARPYSTGIMIGLAAAAKPWGIVLLPMVLAFDGRQRLRAVAASGAVLAVTWLPFLIADSGTVSAGELEVTTNVKSVLHLFGADVGSSPDWVRPAQLVIALVFGVLAVRQGRWAAVLLLGVVVRVLLDPAVFDYYMTAVVVGAFAWELLRTARPVPVLTMGVFWLLLVAGVALHVPTLEAILRLAGGLGALAGAFWLPTRATSAS